MKRLALGAGLGLMGAGWWVPVPFPEAPRDLCMEDEAVLDVADDGIPHTRYVCGRPLDA